MSKIAFLFAGQGAQAPGMGKSLYENIDAREVFEAANKAAGRDVAALCLEAGADELQQVENTQLAVLTMDLAAYAAIAKTITPGALAGFSLGEYAALCASGALTLDETYKLIIKRGEWLGECLPAEGGGMTAVLGLSIAQVEGICREAGAYPANDNAEGQVVVSGTLEALDKVEACAKTAGGKARRIKVGGPFHSVYMKGAASKLEAELAGLTLRTPKTKLLSNVTADWVTEADEIKRLLPLQTMSPVRWRESMFRLRDEGFTDVVELGPGKTLCGLLKRVEGITAHNVQDVETLEGTLSKLRG